MKWLENDWQTVIRYVTVIYQIYGSNYEDYYLLGCESMYSKLPVTQHVWEIRCASYVNLPTLWKPLQKHNKKSKHHSLTLVRNSKVTDFGYTYSKMITNSTSLYHKDTCVSRMVGWVALLVEVLKTTACECQHIENLFLNNFIKILIFFEIFATWMRIPDTWIPR